MRSTHLGPSRRGLRASVHVTALAAALAAIGGQVAAAEVPLLRPASGFAFIDMDVSPESITYGELVHVEVQMEDASTSCHLPIPDCDAPQGTITLFDNGSPILTGTLSPYLENRISRVVFDVQGLTAGQHQLHSEYSGDFDPATSGVAIVTVAKTNCSLALSASPSTSEQGEQIMLVATVDRPLATGTVSFYYDGDVLLGTANLSGVQAAISTTALPVGDWDLQASYAGDANHNGCDSPLVEHIVTAANRAPIAVADSASTPMGQPLTIDVLANDSDPDGDTLSIVDVRDAVWGSAVASGGGTVTYTPPDPTFVGSDQFEYTIDDGRGLTAVASVDIDVTCTASGSPDSYNVDHDTPLVVEAPGVLFNDQSCGLNASHIDGARHGDVVLDAAGGFTYTPDDGYSGPDSFRYRFFDPAIGEVGAPVEVTLNVGPPDCTPAVVDDLFTVQQGTALQIPAPGVAANDTLCGRGVAVVEGPGHGDVTLDPDGSLTYTPDPAFSGADAFTYTLVGASAAPFGEAFVAEPRVVAPGDTATVTISVVAAAPPTTAPPLTPTTTVAPPTTTPAPTPTPTTVAPPASVPTTAVPGATPETPTATLPATR